MSQSGHQEPVFRRGVQQAAWQERAWRGRMGGRTAPSGLTMGTILMTKRRRRARARGSFRRSKKSTMPLQRWLAGVSPGCTLAETKSMRFCGKCRAGSSTSLRLSGKHPVTECAHFGQLSCTVGRMDQVQAQRAKTGSLSLDLLHQDVKAV